MIDHCEWKPFRLKVVRILPMSEKHSSVKPPSLSLSFSLRIRKRGGRYATGARKWISSLLKRYFPTDIELTRRNLQSREILVRPWAAVRLALDTAQWRNTCIYIYIDRFLLDGWRGGGVRVISREIAREGTCSFVLRVDPSREIKRFPRAWDSSLFQGEIVMWRDIGRWTGSRY